jgi:hypothetical protein
MRLTRSVASYSLAALAAITLSPVRVVHAADAMALRLESARVSLDGTSNLHDFTATTTTVRVAAMEVGPASEGDLLDSVLRPGGLETFEIVIPAATLLSPKDDLNKNMHKALKVQQYADIRFRLKALEPAGGAYRATGWLTVAGVEKEVTLTLQVQRSGGGLAVTGGTELMMPDFGITPPKALLGMVKANPKVQITLALVLSAPQA